MNTRQRTETLLTLAAVALVGLVLTARSANAESITVPNAGFEERLIFEDPVTSFPESTDKYNKWAQESWRHWEVDNNGGPLRIWRPGNPGNPAHLTTQGIADVGFGGNAPEGELVVVVRSRYNDDEFHNPPQVRHFEAATQLLTETFDPTMSYTLTAKVGQLPGSANYAPNWFGYSLQLAVGGTNVSGATFQGWVDGGTIIAEDLNSLNVPVDTFVTSMVTYSPNPAHSGLAGQPLQIRLAALENPADHSLTGWVAFDDVTLDKSVIPEPSSFVLAALGLLGLMGLRRQRNRR